MKMLRAPLLMIGLLLCSQGFAATDQQNKMTTCNADATAKSLKGSVDKSCYTFIRQCSISVRLLRQKTFKCVQVAVIRINPIFNNRRRQSLERNRSTAFHTVS